MLPVYRSVEPSGLRGRNEAFHSTFLPSFPIPSSPPAAHRVQKMGPPKQVTRCSCGRQGCDAEERVQNTANVLGCSLNGATLILSTLKNLADGGMTPGLKQAAGTVLVLISLVQVRILPGVVCPSIAQLRRCGLRGIPDADRQLEYAYTRTCLM